MVREILVTIALATGIAGCAERFENRAEDAGPDSPDAASDAGTTLPGPCCVNDAELQALVCLDNPECECCSQ